MQRQTSDNLERFAEAIQGIEQGGFIAGQQAIELVLV
jgi:hypothetical protein